MGIPRIAARGGFLRLPMVGPARYCGAGGSPGAAPPGNDPNFAPHEAWAVLQGPSLLRRQRQLELGTLAHDLNDARVGEVGGLADVAVGLARLTRPQDRQAEVDLHLLELAGGRRNAPQV